MIQHINFVVSEFNIGVPGRYRTRENWNPRVYLPLRWVCQRRIANEASIHSIIRQSINTIFSKNDVLNGCVSVRWIIGITNFIFLRIDFYNRKTGCKVHVPVVLYHFKHFLNPLNLRQFNRWNICNSVVFNFIDISIFISNKN